MFTQNILAERNGETVVFARSQRILALASLTGFAVGAIFALTGCFGANFGAWPVDRGMKLLGAAIATGAVALVCGAVWLTRALQANDGASGRIGIVGLAGALILVGIPAHHLWLEFSLPRIHDVSTDIGDAPAFHDTLTLRKGAPNPADYDGPQVIRFDGKRVTVAVAQKYAYPDIKPVERLAGTIPQKEFISKYFWRSLNAVNALGWQVAGYDAKAGTIEATSASFWFGIVSDIAIRVRPAGAIGVRVDIRAKSRIGTADHGRNAELVRTFMRRIKSN
jgi:hypothetical protein